MYVTIDHLLAARKEIQNNIESPETFAGIIALLLCSEKIQDFYYCANMNYFSNLTNNAFTLKETKAKVNDKSWYALFTPQWANRLLQSYLNHYQINVYTLLVTLFWHQKQEFILQAKDRLKTLIGEHDFYTLFTDETLDIYHSNTSLNKQQILAKIGHHTNEAFTIKYDNSFIKKDAGDLNSAPFGQTLYSALGIKEIINIFEFDIIDEFNRVKDNYQHTLPLHNHLSKANKPNIPHKPQNLILYGVAGVGKSHYIDEKLAEINEDFIERIVFHLDYSNADFIGQILPTVESGNISYQFKAGPFTKILKKAFENTNQHCYLIIEEINRGNAPAIFGEIFQLLDRKNTGESCYPVSHEQIATYIYGTNRTNDFIYIPSNLSILATMNTADQNVFTLDTAFQRRWTMRMIENNIEKCAFKNEYILDTSITWKVFNSIINKIILNANKETLSSEDKRLGAYFVKQRELELPDDKNAGIPFAEKVIKYLWDDALKFNRTALFAEHFNCLDEVLQQFSSHQEDQRLKIFNEQVNDLLGLNAPQQAMSHKNDDNDVN